MSKQTFFRSAQRKRYNDNKVYDTNISNFISQLNLGKSNQEIVEEELGNVY